MCATAPRRKDDVDDHRSQPLPTRTSARGPTRRSRPRPRVLIVDDSPHTRELYSEYLTFRGLAVITAADGESALRLALTTKPDLVVLDLAMPGMNGITVVHRLKRDRHTRRIPIVVLTGHALRAIHEGALEAGADVFLTKPCLPEDLEQDVRRLLDTSRG
jgi:two-component system cell cycle response regulator DivK